MKDGFVKVAAGTPQIKTADCRHNAEAVFTLMREAYHQGVRVLVLPELCLTGSTCGDLFFQKRLIDGACEALGTVLEATRALDMLAAVGLPWVQDGALYSAAAVIHMGRLLGVVRRPRPDGGQARWFAPCDAAPPVFSCATLPELTAEIIFGGDAPVRGAALSLCLSATPELIGAADRRRGEAAFHSARHICAYLRAEAGEGESTTDQVFAGHNLIAERGARLAERQFSTGLTVSEVDLELLSFHRRRAGLAAAQGAEIPFALETGETTLTRRYSCTPFVPDDAAERARRCDEVFRIAALGLKTRLAHTGAKTAVVGLSGGLDSTLAMLITMVAMRLLGRPEHDVIAVTMPCFGTTERTRSNAVELAQLLGATLRRIDISDSVLSHFSDIGQSADRHDAVFENAQARERTQVLMDIANQTGGLVVGTGDLSELSLGWATYNGDHMSMYGVNAGIPKTLVRHLVGGVAADKAEEDIALSHVLDDILDTPVSPELLPAVAGRQGHVTEDLVGPYELHDFFLYHSLGHGQRPAKLLRMAEYAFGRTYSRAELVKWMRVFFTRFFSQQFKRSCSPDGPQIGCITLSPRGGLILPSDAAAALWLEELESL